MANVLKDTNYQNWFKKNLLDNLNSFIFLLKIEFVTRNIYPKAVLGPDGFMRKLNELFNREIIPKPENRKVGSTSQLIIWG